jgi:hypothetical protein
VQFGCARSPNPQFGDIFRTLIEGTNSTVSNFIGENIKKTPSGNATESFLFVKLPLWVLVI